MSNNEPVPPEQPAAEPAPEPAAARPRRTHPILRALGILVAIIAALLVATLTIDLGPRLKGRAEKAASSYIDRPMHIGTLKIKLLSGAFELDNVVIEGLKPTDRPFLTAKRIFVNLPWWTIFSGELIVSDVDMSDWDMLVETFQGGRHNFPRFGGPPKDKNQPQGPKRFTTTVSSVIARRGKFTYEDHGTPWSVVCPNLDVSVFRGLDAYRGTAQFSKGTVTIQNYQPFAASMQTRFKIDNGRVVLDDINLQSTGASSRITGYVDLSRFPEMLYRVKSRIDFPTQKDIFFKDLNFATAGYGDFTGTFHISKDWRELKGTFTSPEAGVNAWRFQDVKGAVLWTPTEFAVTDVDTALYGGRARFKYALAPLGQRRKPTMAVWDADYRDIDLTRISDFLEIQGIRLSGRATGRNRLEWPLGKWSEKHGEGTIAAEMPPGGTPMTRQMPAGRIARVDPLPPEQGPFTPNLFIGHVPIAGNITYTIDPEWIDLATGSVATEKTYVEFDGRTAWGQRSRIPFHVTSLDWQESDRVLAGIMTAFGSPTGAIPISGRGEFDGTMLGAFGQPRIEGHFVGDRMRAWDVVWGHGVADLVIENAYVYIKNGVITHGPSEIDAEGKFSLGYPRKDHGEEINASVRMSKRPLADLRHAFDLDVYPVDGLASGEYHLYGMYTTPDGYGRLQIENGVAYGETFETATADLTFEGSGTPGVSLHAIDIRKGLGGQLTGSATVGWDGTYSFSVDGKRIAIESLKTLAFPRAPLSGLMQITASGIGRFDDPRYDVNVYIPDLFAGDEGIGVITGNLHLRNDMLTMESLEISSPRLTVSGTGRLALTPEMDAEMSLQFSNASLEPYVRFFQPKLSPFTKAIAQGTIRVSGELADIDHLLVEARVDKLDMTLFDYRLHNDGRIELALNRHTVDVQRFKLAGEGTALELDGQIDLHDNKIGIGASGDASLGILQGFFRDVRSSGNASLHASISGSVDAPVFSGAATISDGRFRYTELPHSLQSINGKLSFDAQGVRVDDVTAELGGGAVHIGGRIGLRGYVPATLDLTATGDRMRLRYPEGFDSVVNASIALRGEIGSPVLSGTVDVLDGVYRKRIETNVNIVTLTGGGKGLPTSVAAASAFPLRFDIQIHAPSTLRVDNNVGRLVARADLTLGGTYDRPVLFGRADIERGEILFEGQRYQITRGTIDFLNPTRIEPYFDIEAETRVQAPAVSASSAGNDVYRVTFAVSGVLGGRMSFQLNSDPYLPQIDILGLLFGQTTDVSNPELRALQSQNVTQSEEQLLRLGLTRFLTAPIYAPATRALESSLGIDTVQFSPSVGSATDPLTPTARLIVGKRLSDRAFLTYSRALGSTIREQIIVLEYDQSDRVGWILTQSGANSYSIDFRVRRRF